MPALSPEFEALLAKCTPADEAAFFERLVERRFGKRPVAYYDGAKLVETQGIHLRERHPDDREALLQRARDFHNSIPVDQFDPYRDD
jgi:hypothetical protein